MGKVVKRSSGSSSDQMILPVEYTDIFQLLKLHPRIKKLIFASSSGLNSAEGWFRNYCSLNKIYYPKLIGRNPKKGIVSYNNREIPIVTVHSTSGAAARKDSELIKMYKAELK